MLGESIAVNGVCLTVDKTEGGVFSADASSETLARTTVGALRAGARVNLERALTPTSRLGGHIVGGHVDGHLPPRRAQERRRGRSAACSRCPFRSRASSRAKGSVSLDGISLTVNDVVDSDGDSAFDW